MWQTVESKAKAIKSLMKRHQTSRGMDDIDPFILGVAEAKALASGNPLVKRAEEVKLKVMSGRASRAAHQRASHDARTQQQTLESQTGLYAKWLPPMDIGRRTRQKPPAKGGLQRDHQGEGIRQAG